MGRSSFTSDSSLMLLRGAYHENQEHFMKKSTKTELQQTRSRTKKNTTLSKVDRQTYSKNPKLSQWRSSKVVFSFAHRN